MPECSPTVYDVAERAGVAIPTVSRVLRGVTTVDPALRARVFDASEQLGYRPNSLARRLSGTDRGAVGLAMPTDLTHPFYLTLAAHPRDVALREG